MRLRMIIISKIVSDDIMRGNRRSLINHAFYKLDLLRGLLNGFISDKFINFFLKMGSRLGGSAHHVSSSGKPNEESIRRSICFWKAI